MTYEVTLGRDMYDRKDELINWCIDHIDPNWTWSQVTCMFGYTTFYFTNEKDALYFSLVWS